MDSAGVWESSGKEKRRWEFLPKGVCPHVTALLLSLPKAFVLYLLVRCIDHGWRIHHSTSGTFSLDGI